MRYLFLFMFVFTARAFAIDLLTPVIGTGYCTVTGVSAATPAVVTVTDITKCGIANDDYVWVHGIRNTGSANRSSLNLHLVNAADNNGKARVVKSVGIGGNPNAFTLRARDGTTNITNNGTYATDGQIAKGQFRTLPALPTGTYFDTALTACLTNTTSTGCAYASRSEYTALQTAIAACGTLTHLHEDIAGGCTLLYALGWWAEGKPGSSTNRTRMINGLVNSTPRQTAACDGSLDCMAGGITGSSLGDYAYEVYGPNFIKALALGWSELSAPQKATLERYYMDDFDFTKGGHDYDGSTKAYDTYFSSPGTVDHTAGVTTITGHGTSFAVGDVGKLLLIGFQTGGYAHYFEICSYTSATLIDLCVAPTNDYAGTATLQGYRLARNWPDDGTMIGHFGLNALNNFGMMCGSYPNRPECGTYGSGGGGTSLDLGSNHQIGRVSYFMLNAFVLAATGASPRAEWLATDCMFVWYHVFWPWQMGLGGIASQSSHYYQTRMVPYFADTMGGIRNSFTDAPDYTGGGANGAIWWDELAKESLAMFYKEADDAAFQQNGEFGNTLFQYAAFGSPLSLIQMNPTGAYSSALKYYFKTTLAKYNAGYGYLGMRPDVVSTQGTNTSFITRAPLAPSCITQWSSSICGTDLRLFFGSRSGTSLSNAWGANGTAIWYQWSSVQRRDHHGQLEDVGPYIASNGNLLLSGDGERGVTPLSGGISHGNILVLGGESNTKNGHTTGIGLSVPIYDHGTATLAAGGVNIAGHYIPAANVLVANRGIVHLKAGGHGFVITRDDFAATGSLTATTYNHFNISSQGLCSDPLPITPTCLTLNRAAKTVTATRSATARIDAKFSGTVNTENSSDTDGSYSGYTGYTFRVTNSVTGTSGTLWGFFRPSGTGVNAMPTIDEADTGNFHKVEFKDTTYAATALVPAVATLNETAVTFTTSYAASSGQVVVGGLVNQSYTLSRGGSPIAGCTGLAVDNHMFDCPNAGVSGSMSLAAVGASGFGSAIIRGGKGSGRVIVR